MQVCNLMHCRIQTIFRKMHIRQKTHLLQALAKLPQHIQITTEGNESARGGRKRERQSSEGILDARWSLKQKLAALTQDIELLTQEVSWHSYQ